MDRWIEKVAVVTGASSGIGLAIAKTLVERGLIVIGLARRKSKMEEEMKNVNGKFYALECDVCNEQQVNEAFDWIKRNFKTVHILVNNAGIIKVGKIANLEFYEMKKIIDVNFIGLLYISKLAINIMKEKGHESHIIMINSIAGLRANPIPFDINVYCATKFAVKALSATMQKELLEGNIRVTNISPGAVKTEMFDTMSEIIPVIKEMDALKAEDIADAVVYVLGTPARVLIEELTIKPLKAQY